MAPRPANSSIAADPASAAASPHQTEAGFRFPLALAEAIERCWRKADPPADWNLSRQEFVAALERSAARRFARSRPDEKSIEAFLDALHLGDLALARACSAGNPPAWDYFIAKFRPDLYRAARAIAGEANSRELADSLYADLYGLRESEGRRQSLFDYFHGRSKLATWLHAVLAQRHVDEIRRTRRTEPLEDENGIARTEIFEKAPAPRHSASLMPDPERPKYLAALQTALSAVLAALVPRDCLRLAYYYADGRTLAEIGRLLGEHEATASRKLERTRRDVRDRVETSLREQKRWSDAQVKLCFEYARGEWPFDLERSLRSGQAPAEAQPGVASAPD